jgi:hypothetical protein
MKSSGSIVFLLLAVLLLVTAGCQADVSAEERVGPLQDELIGVWQFPVDGYYVAFDEQGRMCYGGSEESAAAGRWCNDYTLEGDIVTETCMGGPEDRSCPLGGGSCQARVSVPADGQLRYEIIADACNMLGHKLAPPLGYTITRR